MQSVNSVLWFWSLQRTSNSSRINGRGLVWTEALLMDTHPEWRTLMLLYPASPPYLLSLFPRIVIPWMGLSGLQASRPRYKTFLCKIKGQSPGPSEGVSQLVTTIQAHHTYTVNTQHTVDLFTIKAQAGYFTSSVETHTFVSSYHVVSENLNPVICHLPQFLVYSPVLKFDGF